MQSEVLEFLESELTDQSESLKIDPEPLKFYVVLGDSLQGYYIVKCLTCGDEYFHGKYMSTRSESAQSNRVILKETQSKDKFALESIVSEIIVITEVNDKNVARLSIEKEELSDILVTIGEMSDN